MFPCHIKTIWDKYLQKLSPTSEDSKNKRKLILQILVVNVMWKLCRTESTGGNICLSKNIQNNKTLLGEDKGGIWLLEILEVSNPLGKLKWVIAIKRNTKKVACLYKSYYSKIAFRITIGFVNQWWIRLMLNNFKQ